MQYCILSLYKLLCRVFMVSSCHGEFVLQGEVVSFLFSVSSEAPSPGQLWLLQQPACQVNTSYDNSKHIPY